MNGKPVHALENGVMKVFVNGHATVRPISHREHDTGRNIPVTREDEKVVWDISSIAPHIVVMEAA